MLESRMNRLFGESGHCFDVAIDHGMFNQGAFLRGIENMDQAISAIVEADPDAIQLPPGSARILQGMNKPKKPALVLRTDIANCYGTELVPPIFSEMIENPVERAVRLDAACVVVNLLQLPNETDLYRQCLTRINALRKECEIYSMPLMVEPLVMQPNSQAGGYMVDGDLDKIVPLVRQASELGADIIKADPCDDVSEYHKVIETAQRVPVLVRGGGRVSDDEILNRTAQLMKQGAKGIVYGRNVIQHHDPAGITRALMAVVHQGTTPEDAKAMIGDA
ncbi:class I fructose-bisphosphate aldolase [Vibrio nigripulchritudo]|uniref:class I fructose-bisphosphate aldolase n=1 Tax=Vibrio nigripulchritudo TaxID=28173 RepID=UPI0005FA544A|nr:aldolase [Vibrio nigripulchritudo]KJY80927.1 aldolase [Vibrio nigripulchritudo]